MLIPFKSLFPRHNIKANGVLHLGANTGQEAAAYAEQGITRVVWVEALPAVFAQLMRNVAQYKDNVALCACVSDVDGRNVRFNIANNSAQSSSLLEFGTHTAAHPAVQFVGNIEMVTTRVDSLLQRQGITLTDNWFLNIDLQGAELMALKGMGDLLKHFAYAYIEVNTAHLYKGCPLVGEVDAFLSQYGFVGKETKMTSAGWGDKFYQKVL